MQQMIGVSKKCAEADLCVAGVSEGKRSLNPRPQISEPLGQSSYNRAKQAAQTRNIHSKFHLFQHTESACQISKLLLPAYALNYELIRE
jgi:hypothetical protein